MLNITTQTPTGANFDLGGYTDVLCAVGTDCHGRLLWMGTLFPDDTLNFTYYDVVANALGSPTDLSEDT